MASTNNTLGDQLKAYRESRGWTQAQLARYLTRRRGWSVTQAQVSTWETGETSMSESTAHFVRRVIAPDSRAPKQAS